MFGTSLAGTATIGGSAVMLSAGIQTAWTVFAGVTLFTAGLIVKNIIPKDEF